MAEAVPTFRPWIYKAINARNKRLVGYLVTNPGENYVWAHVISSYVADSIPELPEGKALIKPKDFALCAEELTLSGHGYRVRMPLYQDMPWGLVIQSGNEECQ